MSKTTERDKIFDKSVREYLKEAGVSDVSIRKILHEKYKEGMLKIAYTLVKAIEEEDYELIKPYTAHSPAGDCMGMEDIIISFASITAKEEDIGDDICSTNVKDAFSILNRYGKNNDN